MPPRAAWSKDDKTTGATYMDKMPDGLHFLPDRAVLELKGPDTIALLERLVTNNTADWTKGERRYGALLTPQGKVIADYLAERTEEGGLLDVAAGHVEDLAKRLKLFRLRSDVEIEIRADLFVVTGTVGEEGLAEDPRSASLPARGFSTGTDPAPDTSYMAARIAAGIPEQGEDFASGEVFPAEINMDLLGGVDLKKGCFVGQEVVSRMHRRGNIRKRTVAISGEGLTAGSDIIGETPLGVITSATDTHALARLRLDRLAAALAKGQALSVDDKPVTLQETDWLSQELAAFQTHD